MLPGVRTCYGIDRSADHVVVVRAVRARKALRFETVVDQPLDADAAGLEARAAALQAEAAKGRAVLAGCVPVHESFARWLQTPLVSESKARKILPSLLDIQLPFPLETCVYRFLAFRRGGGRAGGPVDALAVAVRLESLKARLEQYGRAGLEPARLDHEGVALWTRSVEELPMERDALRVVACVGREHTSLVLGRGGELLSAHSIRLGARQLLAGGPTEGTGDDLRHFAARAQQILRAQFPESGAAPLQWFWAGAGAMRREGLEKLQAALGFIGAARFLVHDAPDTFLARALAARALPGAPLACNFREGALAHPFERQRAARGREQVAAAALAAGLALCAMNLGWRAVLVRTRSVLQAETGRLASELAGASRVPKGQEVLVVRRALEERAGQAAPFLQAFRPSASGLLYEIVRLAGQKRLEIESLSVRPSAVALRGTADDWNHCGLLADLLRERGLAVEQPERQDAGADERVHFALKASRGGAP